MFASFVKFSCIHRLVSHSMSLCFVALCAVACWAPEVEPPTPKKSPAELAGLAISSAHADVPATLLETTTEDSLPTIEKTESIVDQSITPQPRPQPQYSNAIATNFPKKGKTLTPHIPIYGHGGGIIMHIEKAGTDVQIMESADNKLRILCVNCSNTATHQAGWVSIADVEIQ